MGACSSLWSSANAPVWVVLRPYGLYCNATHKCEFTEWPLEELESRVGNFFFVVASSCSAEQMSEPERLEKEGKIETLKEQLKILHDQEESIGYQIRQFQQAVSAYKEDIARLK